LVLEGAQAASDARDSVGIDLIAPVDIYAVAEAIGIRVRFLPVSMEGFYRKGSPPRVMLSALRPLARRAFTCAHEIGHHWFGHGSTIDELQGDDRHDSDIPEENPRQCLRRLHAHAVDRAAPRVQQPRLEARDRQPAADPDDRE
jgi:hypothetical protein